MQANDRTPEYLNFKAVLQARAAAQQHGLPRPYRHLLEVIAGFTNGHPAFPSYQTLGGICDLSPERVRHYATTLGEMGYLAITRRPRDGGGRGHPQWALGPLCQTVTPDRLQSSNGHQWPVQTVTPDRLQTVTSGRPKRVSVVPGDSVVHGNDGGEAKSDGKREDEERTTAKAVSPKKQRIADVCDAIKAQGGEAPRLSGRDAGAICASDALPEEIATAWLRLIGGQWPTADASPRDRAFAQNNRMMWFAVDRLTTILAAPAPTNGHPVRGAASIQIRTHPR